MAATPSAARRRLSSFHLPAKSPAATPRLPVADVLRTPRGSGDVPDTPRDLSRRRVSFGGTALKSARRASVTAGRARRESVAKPKGPVMSGEEIASMYSATIKLCQDNKITAKNTWSLNLIDYMSMLVKDGRDSGATSGATPRKTVSFQDGNGDVGGEGSDTTEGTTNFQLAGVTLDAGVKIYCSRVDSVHSNAFKVLGGLSRNTGHDGREEPGSDAEGHDVDEAQDGKRKRRGVRRAGGATLERNMDNISARKLETDLAVDPLFQKMSAAFDEGGAKGMLLNNLPVGPQGQILFDSGESANVLVMDSSSTAVEEQTYNVSELIPPDPPAEGDALCPRFLRFYNARVAGFAPESLAAEDSVASTGAFTRDAEDDDAFGNLTGPDDFDFEYGSGDMQNGTALGVMAAAFEANSGADGGDRDDDDDVFGHPHDPDVVCSSLDSDASLAASALSGRVDLIEAGVALRADSEYAFFDAASLSGWAGPQHWRFRATATTSAGKGDKAGVRGSSTASAKETKRPRGKTAMLLDFSSEAPKLDFASEFAPGKTESANQLSTAVRGGFSEKKVTLPEDLHLSTRTLTTLFLKPRVFVVPKGSWSGGLDTRFGIKNDLAVGQDGEDNGWYDFDNDCDQDNFCPASDGHGFGGDENGCGFGDNSAGNGLNSIGLDLVPEPTRVDKLDINYAKVAKRVDVRQLKSGMWSRLCGGAEDAVLDENDGSSPTVRMSQNPARESSVSSRTGQASVASDVRDGGIQTLQDIVQDMPSFIPETSLPDVSLPYVFICLLHLANEKTLCIQQAAEDALDDLVITHTGDDE